MNLEQLPQEFLERMEHMLGEEYPAFLQSYEEPRKFGLRVNTMKISVEEFQRLAPFHLTPIPWIPRFFIMSARMIRRVIHSIMRVCIIFRSRVR